MARNLCQAGMHTTVWNRTIAKAQPLAAFGANVAKTAAEAVAGTDIVISMLSDGPTGVLVQSDPELRAALRGGAIWVEMGSIKPEEARAAALSLEELGVHYVDAPVSGGTKGAEEASLAIMAGGAAEEFANVTAALSAMGRPVHVGPVGAGQLAKLANQAIVGITIADIRGPEEAAAYVTKLRQIMQYLGTCDGNMQNGSLRADVNVSVCRPGDYERYQDSQDFDHLGTRCEIKNMNSMRFMQAAIDFEARRQIAILEDGGSVKQETRLYDADKNETRSMRSKEEAHDYRYFPCPDLLPLVIQQDWINDLAAGLPELPDAKKSRFIADFGLSAYDASVLTAETHNASYFEKVAQGRDGKVAANWVINELFGRMKKDDVTIANCPVTPDQLGGIIDLIGSAEISGKIAKDLFEIVYTEGGDPAEIVTSRGMKQVTDTGAIEAAVDQIIADNPAQVEKAKLNPKLAGWFVGQVIKATGGKANPQVVNEIVAARLAL